MEVVIIILALVYSVWSELQKKKQEEDVNIDFSELTTLDDFFKKPSDGSSVSGGNSDGGYKHGKKQKKPKKQPNSSDFQAAAGLNPRGAQKAEVSYDDLPSLESKGYESSFGRVEVNYDELPTLTGRNSESQPTRAEVNYDELPTLTGRTNYEDDHEDEKSLAAAAVVEQAHSPGLSFSNRFTISREDLLKTVVLSEVLQRYNINRIYDRIPGLNSDE